MGDGEAHSIVPNPIPPAKLLPGDQYPFSPEAVPFHSSLGCLTKTRPPGSRLNAKCTFSKRAIFTLKKEETNTDPCLLNAKNAFSKRLVNAKKCLVCSRAAPICEAAHLPPRIKPVSACLAHTHQAWLICEGREIADAQAYDCDLAHWSLRSAPLFASLPSDHLHGFVSPRSVNGAECG